MFSPSLVLFDCDGVLIDSEILSLRALTETLALVHGVQISQRDALERFMGKSEASEIANIQKINGVKVSADYLARKKQRRTELFDQSLQAMPGVAALTDALPMKKCVASSSSPERLRHSLGLTGLWDKFAPDVFSATMVKNGKPAPDLFLYAAAQMGVEPAQCLVVEDSPAGVAAGKAAGMVVYGFTGGSHCDAGHGALLSAQGADALFSSMHDIALNLGIDHVG